MCIYLFLKCATADAFNFISQFTAIDFVKEVIVFRDTPSLPDKKVEYVLPIFKKISFLKYFSRIPQVLFRKPRKPNLIAGIYEIPHGLFAMLAGKLLNVPSVVSIIGNPAYSKLRKGMRMKLTIWILKNCDMITVTGTHSREFLAKKGIDQNKIFILPNSLDLSPFAPMYREKEFDLISLGRISDEKHIELFVALVARLKEINPDIRAAIGGEGPQKARIIQLINKMGLQDQIVVQGFIPEAQLTEFFNKGKVFVLTSETEGFPRTIVQAAACGVPVVAARVGDVADMIDNGTDGFMVEDYSDVEEYSRCALQLLNDKDLRERFAAELNQKVRRRFSTESASAVWREILQRAG